MIMNKKLPALLISVALAPFVVVGVLGWPGDEHASQLGESTGAQASSADQPNRGASDPSARAALVERTQAMAVSARSEQHKALVLRGVADKSVDREEVAASAVRGLASLRSEPGEQTSDSRQYVSPFSK